MAWITGHAAFGDLTVRADPEVYVPAEPSVWPAEPLRSCSSNGKAIDLCTGSGAVAAAIGARRPSARIVATDRDALAVACARENGIDAYRGDLFAAVPAELRGVTDVIVAVVPYVPSTELRLLPATPLGFEDASHYDGGFDGTDVLRRVVTESPRFLRPGGALLLELGGAQADLLGPTLAHHGYGAVRTWTDEDGDPRGLEATLRRR